MLLVYVHKSTSRVKYAFNVVFRELIKLPFEITSDLEKFNTCKGPKFSYHTHSLDNEFFVQSNDLLFESGIVEQEIIPIEIENTTALFGCSPKSNFAFDVFSATFYMVCRYEEYLPHKRDEHDRFEAKQSISTKFNFLNKPVVNQWAELFWQALSSHLPDLVRKKSKYNFLTTIDIDNAYQYKEKGFIRTISGYAKSIFSLNFSSLKHRLLVQIGRKVDPYDTYAYQLDTIKKHKLNFIYFFLLGDYGVNDKNIPISNPKFRSLIKHLSDYADVGIHPSYASNTSFKALEAEVNKLSPIIKKEVTQSRQHFLKLKFPETYRNLIDLDILNDYSMGYASHPGFRAGICTPYYFYDLDLEVETRLQIHPFSVMEVTLQYYLKIKPEEAVKIYTDLIDEVKAVNGTFISVWHNDTLANEGIWKGWRNTFEKMIEHGKE